MITESLLQVVLALLPVIAFLLSLVMLDSFKLVRMRDVAITIAVGSLAALVCYGVNVLTATAFSLSFPVLTRYVAPVVEECAKAAFMIVLLRSDRIGFLVDATIRGFALGAGFALVENLYYLLQHPDASMFTWVVRGFGTALMHGGATSIVAMTAKTLLDRAGSWRLSQILPGLVLAIVLHALFNRFILSPLISTTIILLLFPLVIIVIYRRSEHATRDWFGAGFDADRELLEMLGTGVLSETPVGRLLQSLQDRFPPETVADMLCYLRLYSELAIKAKGILLMRDAGFEVPPDDEAKGTFEELRFLEKSIGVTGVTTLRPFLRLRSRDLWQLHFLRGE